MFLVRCTKPLRHFQSGLVYRSRGNPEARGRGPTIRTLAGHIEPSEEGSDEHGDYPVGDDGTYLDLAMSTFTGHFEWFRPLVLELDDYAESEVEMTPPDSPGRRLEVDAAPGLIVSARRSGTSDPYVSLHSPGLDLSDFAPGVPVRFDLRVTMERPSLGHQIFPGPRCVITSGPSSEGIN